MFLTAQRLFLWRNFYAIVIYKSTIELQTMNGYGWFLFWRDSTIITHHSSKFLKAYLYWILQFYNFLEQIVEIPKVHFCYIVNHFCIDIHHDSCTTNFSIFTFLSYLKIEVVLKLYKNPLPHATNCQDALAMRICSVHWNLKWLSPYLLATRRVISFSA